ncbi:hypothetical protein [Enterovibrio paralichthyis]|uniref:hypothetical protein n=1 Tax=Enterovibrio paralichthyis TaxID=2853805 RepID=UPI001C462767|nr:hypothetical protein [Enterovibrio paralichthyis]MBV7296616.1 hypothetical protein [Enterovibrio paralichthyis]
MADPLSARLEQLLANTDFGNQIAAENKVNTDIVADNTHVISEQTDYVVQNTATTADNTDIIADNTHVINQTLTTIDNSIGDIDTGGIIAAIEDLKSETSKSECDRDPDSRDCLPVKAGAFGAPEEGVDPLEGLFNTDSLDNLKTAITTAEIELTASYERFKSILSYSPLSESGNTPTVEFTLNHYRVPAVHVESTALTKFVELIRDFVVFGAYILAVYIVLGARP